MERNLMIAGFGGQGVMLTGKLLAYSACRLTGKNVTFFPSYGAEQRGGTANCYVVTSDEEIGDPLGDAVDELIVLNEPSRVRFLHKLKKGGLLFTNSSLVTRPGERGDLTIIEGPGTERAIRLGDPRVLNVIMLGAYVGFTEAVPAGTVHDTMIGELGKKPRMIPLNEKAFRTGLELGEKAREKR